MDSDKKIDRDDRALAMQRSKTKSMLDKIPKSQQKHWGSATSRFTVASLMPSREDEYKRSNVPGRNVPVGFARYVSPVIDPSVFAYYRIAGWRVAVPRTIPAWRVQQLLYLIYNKGPKAAGYARHGDTLVPSFLNYAERATARGHGPVAYPLTS